MQDILSSYGKVPWKNILKMLDKADYYSFRLDRLMNEIDGAIFSVYENYDFYLIKSNSEIEKIDKSNYRGIKKRAAVINVCGMHKNGTGYSGTGENIAFVIEIQ